MSAKSELVHAGPIDGGFAGIDGDFMVENGLLFVVAITTDGQGAIMTHPGFDIEKGPELLPLIKELNRQAAAVLSGDIDGMVH